MLRYMDELRGHAALLPSSAPRTPPHVFTLSRSPILWGCPVLMVFAAGRKLLAEEDYLYDPKRNTVSLFSQARLLALVKVVLTEGYPSREETLPQINACYWYEEKEEDYLRPTHARESELEPLGEILGRTFPEYAGGRR